MNNYQKSSREYGGTILEALFCMFVLGFVLFGMLQIFQWSVAKILCEYSSFYAAKGESLGYNRGIVERAARVALTAVSGTDESLVPARAPYRRYDLAERAADYMMYSDAGMYGVNFEYWEPDNHNNNTPRVTVQRGAYSSENYANEEVAIANMPLLDPALEAFIFTTQADIPAGKATMFKYSQYYLDE